MNNFNKFQDNIKALEKIEANDTYWELLYDDKIGRLQMNLTDSVDF